MDWNDFKGDWNNSPFFGMYVNKGGRTASISGVELISHITDNLYVGGCERVDLEDFFSHVFSLYKWGSYTVADGTVHDVYTMYDSADEHIFVMDSNENPLQIEDVADKVVEALEEGGNVLVHCQAGINRSNLTAALALMKWKGLSADEAVALLREKRSEHVLANQRFERYLQEK